MSDEIKLNLDSTKKLIKKATNWFNEDRNVKILFLVLLATLIVVGVLIRIQNISLLVDHTTGNYIPLALDPFYWLREATTILQNGHLPAIDPLKHIQGGAGFSSEILPYVIVLLYKFLHFFNSSITLGFADIIYPVIAFALGIIVFYFLTHVLTKSKIAAIIASAFLVIIPTYLYRTMAGFSDHDALGTLMFLSTILVFAYSLNWLDKKKEKGKSLKNNPLFIAGLLGLAVGFMSALTLASWGGIFEFIPMIIPLSFMIMWILKIRDLDEGKKELPKLLTFYISFFVFSLFSGLIFGFSFGALVDRFITTPSSLLSSLTLAFVIIDFLIVKYADKLPIKKIKKTHVLWALGIGVFLGLMVLILHRGGVGVFFGDIVNTLLHPFGTGRVGLTVAENAQPYISNWISQTGTIFFWLFFAGLIPIGISMSKGIKTRKRRITFSILWIFLISGLLLSRISATSVLNGTNFLSKLFYFGSIIIFLIYAVNVYIKEEIKISPNLLILFSMTIFMLIAARGAARLIFTVTLFACLAVGYLIYSLGSYYKQLKHKDDLLKMILILLLLGSIIASAFSFNSLMTQSINQAKYTGPSATTQWQSAMQWVRNNTPTGAVFAHWWDYGYWVEYLGERGTIADGGHFEGPFRDHLIGRYILTEPNPNASLSFMKTNNISYLLIDPSDLGKYPAYSIIGSGNSSSDRYSSAPVMPISSAQTKTIGNTTMRAYQNVVPTDQDIVYNFSSGQQLFIPQGQGYTIGVILNTTKENTTFAFGQPEMVLYYNNQQLRVPLRYIYFNGQLIDFGTGFPGAAYLLPTLVQGSTGIQVNNMGSIIYLSPKVFNSLFAQLYLMNDPLNRYPTVTLAHAQYDPVLTSLRSQGFTGDFVYYNGFDGPIKIWNVKYPSYIATMSGFLDTTGTYAEFDNSTFTK